MVDQPMSKRWQQWSNVWMDPWLSPSGPARNGKILVSSRDGSRHSRSRSVHVTHEDVIRALLGIAVILDAEIVLDGGQVTSHDGMDLRVRRTVSEGEGEGVSMRNVVPTESG